MPPSFRNPKSVVVVALPPLGPPSLSPCIRSVPARSFLRTEPGLVLPPRGALVFSSQFAHDLTSALRAQPLQKARPKWNIDLPGSRDPSKGGLVLKEPAPSLPPGELTGVIHGKWGFDDWTGPQFHLLSPQPGGWTLAAADQSALVVGREDTLHFDGQDTLCVDKVEGQAGDGKPGILNWKYSQTRRLEVSVPMKDAAPGPVTVSIYQYGVEKPEPSHDGICRRCFARSADAKRRRSNGLLKGTRLDEVAKAELDGIALKPLHPKPR